MKQIAIVVLMLVPMSRAAASEVDVCVGAVGAINKEFGTLTPTGWRFHEERGPTIGLRWIFWSDFSISASVADVHEHVRYDGERTSAMRSVPASLMLAVHGPEGVIRPYVGAGVSYLMYRDVVRSPYGVPAQPDHAALIIGGGLDYALSSRWALNLDLKYGPARSTAEVMLPGGTAEHIDFHQFYSGLALRWRF